MGGISECRINSTWLFGNICRWCRLVRRRMDFGTIVHIDVTHLVIYRRLNFPSCATFKHKMVGGMMWLGVWTHNLRGANKSSWFAREQTMDVYGQIHVKFHIFTWPCFYWWKGYCIGWLTTTHPADIANLKGKRRDDGSIYENNIYLYLVTGCHFQLWIGQSVSTVAGGTLGSLTWSLTILHAMLRILKKKVYKRTTLRWTSRCIVTEKRESWLTAITKIAASWTCKSSFLSTRCL